MTQPKLTDPFEHVQKKDIKNKDGRVVAQVDYVGWSQVADRLDAAEPGWSFSVVQLGPDWCLGRLTFKDGRGFENVGYAENVEMAWKKEPLKDAVSDALKRCAALAGVARYLYDKTDDDNSQRRPSSPARPSAPVAPSGGAAGRVPPRPAAPTTPPDVEPEWVRESLGGNGHDAKPLRFGEFRTEIEAIGLTLQEAGQTAKKMFGHSMIKDLTDEQRGDLLAELVA